jgi:hypothetical protein
MKKILCFSAIFFLAVFFGAPIISFAADSGGCSSAGPLCTINTANDGTCAQNTDTGDFYCKANTSATPPAPSPAPAPAQTTNGFVPLAGIPGLTTGVTASQEGLAVFFNNLYKFLIGLAAILAVIEIIWGGLEISTKDSVSKQGLGRERITNAILGLVLVLSPVLVFTIINPKILNLSIDLPPLNLGTGAAPGGGTGTPPPATIDQATGCSFTGTLLKKASCSSQQKAEDFATSAICTANGTGTVLPCQGGVNSYGCADTAYYATCDTSSGPLTGPFFFLDITPKNSLSLITPGLHDTYQPVASTPNDSLDGIPANPNNGNAVIQFQTACNTDKGIVCMSTIKHGTLPEYCPHSTYLPTNSCNYMYIYCTNNPPSTSFLGGCGQSFSVIN